MAAVTAKAVETGTPVEQLARLSATPPVGPGIVLSNVGGLACRGVFDLLG